MATSTSSSSIKSEAPDPSYWTAYDHFMIEREARAMRRAYTWDAMARAGRWLARRFAAVGAAGPSRGTPAPTR